MIDTRRISSDEGVRGSDGRPVVTLASGVIEKWSSVVSIWTRGLLEVTWCADFQTCIDHEPVVRNHFALYFLLCVRAHVHTFFIEEPSTCCVFLVAQPCQRKIF